MSRITQKGATGPLALSTSGSFQTSTDASLATLVGTRWDLSDGREVILGKASSVTTVEPGKLYQDAATVANHQNLAVTAFQAYSANGNTPAKVTVTLGATAATANQYAGGFAVINAGTGAGQTLRISSNPAAASAGSLVVTLEDSPNTALDTSSKVCLISPHGKDVILQPNTTPTGAAFGVGLYPIAASAYGFFTSKGETAGLAQGAIGAGLGISVGTVDGSFAVAAATTSRLGYAVQAGVDTEYRTVFVNL